MRINHVAIWTENLETLRSFYAKYFNGSCGKRYHNPLKGFTSYFITFDGRCRLELMCMDGITQRQSRTLGLAHISFSVGDKENVDELTERLRRDGYTIIGEPRTTGDSYYESVIADPEGNIVEITI